MTENVKKFYIPFVWEVKKHLSDAEYLVFALCHSLDERGKTIYFSNEYMANLLNKSKRRIQQIISTLEIKGFIKRTISGMKRIITIMYDEINNLLGRKEFHPTTKKVAPKPTKNIAPYNIVINNKIDESKNSHDFIKNYLKKIIGENKKNINIELLIKKFSNKYLYDDSKNISNKKLKGMARNFVLAWVGNLRPAETENTAQTPYKRLLDISKSAKTIEIDNGGEVKVKNAEFISKIDNKKYKVYTVLQYWYDKKAYYEVKIDGLNVKR